MAKTFVKLGTGESFTLEQPMADVALEFGRQALAPFTTVDKKNVSIAATAVAYLEELPG